MNGHLLRSIRLQTDPPLADELWLSSSGAYHRVPVADIRRVDAERDYIRVVTAERSFLHRMTLNQFEAEIGRALLIRIHRSRMVTRSDISAVRHIAKGNWRVVHYDGSESPVGRKYGARLKLELGITPAPINQE